MQVAELTVENLKSQILNQKIAELAIEYADQRVPYEHRGMSRNGCDCTGLLVGILQELGFLKDFVLRDYPADWNMHSGADNYVIEELSKYGDEIPKSQATIGDVPVMTFGKCPAHAGIIISGDLVFVHSLITNGFVRKSLLKNSKWSARWLTTFRMAVGKI
jgi:cell wall-associated NlpC family hydrolase